jgi:ABC-type enterobactin transport system permease subunit
VTLFRIGILPDDHLLRNGRGSGSLEAAICKHRRLGGCWAGLLGGAVTALAVVLAAIPPAEAEPWRYMAKVIGGCVVLTLLGRWLFLSSAKAE